MSSNTSPRLGNPFACHRHRHRHRHSGPAILLREEPDQTSAILIAPPENPPDVSAVENDTNGGNLHRPAACRDRTWIPEYPENMSSDGHDSTNEEDEGAIMVLRPRAGSMPASEDAKNISNADADDDASPGSEHASIISIESQSTDSNSSVDNETKGKDKDIEDLVVVESEPLPPSSTATPDQSANRCQPTRSNAKGFVAQLVGLVDSGTKSMRGLVWYFKTDQDIKPGETWPLGVISGVLSSASFQPPPPGESEFH